MNIPLFRPEITKQELDQVQQVLKSGKLSRGPVVEEFEQKFAEYVGKKHAVALNSGTSGLHTAVRALGWGAGDEVITTPFSYIASSNALLYEGVRPVFVDIDADTLNIDIDAVESKITDKTKGMLLVHILGFPLNSEPLRALAAKHDLEIIEDACEAFGRQSDSFPVGRTGAISVYGFHENKQITTLGEGGMIATDCDQLARTCRSMRDQGRATGADWINNVTLGFNFRMTEAQAAFGLAQLGRADSILQQRANIAEQYTRALSAFTHITTPYAPADIQRSWFVYFVLLRSKEERDAVHERLSANWIQSSTNYFPPIYRFPMYAEHREEAFPNTEDTSSRLLVLPMYNDMTSEEVRCVVEALTHA